MLSFLSLVKVEGSDNWDLVMVENGLPSNGRFSTLQIDELFDSLKARLRPVESDSVVAPLPVPKPIITIIKPIVKTLGPNEFAPGKCHGFDAIGRRCGSKLETELHCKKHHLEHQIAAGLIQPIAKLTCSVSNCRNKLINDRFCRKHFIEHASKPKVKVVVVDDSDSDAESDDIKFEVKV